MALVPCQECGQRISSAATACPKCGHPVAKSASASAPSGNKWPRLRGGRVIGLGLFALLIAAAASQKGGDKSEKSAETEKPKCTGTPLQCLADKHYIDAASKCAPLIERLAKNNFEWTDKWYEQKFNKLKWNDEQKGIIAYVGDKIKFQNGFGAWTISTYECDFDTSKDEVLGVRANAGRLPE
jgi:hypothetical protein